MQNELLNNLNKPFLRWQFDQENNWLYLNWIGYISNENVLKGMDFVLKLLRQESYAYLLNDNRNLCGPWSGDHELIKNTLIPQMKEAGLQYLAHVLAPNVAGALSAQNFHRVMSNYINMQLFGNIEKAQQWLKSMQAQQNAR